MKPCKLSTGIQTFEHIIIDNYIYIDKTKYLVELIDNGKIYFFARRVNAFNFRAVR
jgi:hypothetical protein